MTNVGTYKTAFVSGASRGIGLACARALAETGVHVVLAARDTVKLEEASREIPNSTWVAIDLSSADSIKEAFAKAGKIDILVNNAAVTKDGLAVRMKKEDWDR
jgi:3-oxoacyl-[acyl-carrier protein] reductase